jgi:hypothetical protein
MVFNSLQYLAFFPLVFVLYWQLKRRAQNILLLAASWFVLPPTGPFAVGGRSAPSRFEFMHLL